MYDVQMSRGRAKTSPASRFSRRMIRRNPREQHKVKSGQSCKEGNERRNETRRDGIERNLPGADRYADALRTSIHVQRLAACGQSSPLP